MTLKFTEPEHGLDILVKAQVMVALKWALEQPGAEQRWGTEGTAIIRKFVERNSPPKEFQA